MNNIIKTVSSPESIEMVMSFVKNHTEGALTTIDEKGYPHATIININVNASFDSLFITTSDSLKYHDLKLNDRVVFVCFDAHTRDEVQIEGTAVEVTDPRIIDEEKNRVEANITLEQRHTPPYAQVLSDNFVIFCIKPTMIHTVTYKRRDDDIYAYSEKIEFES